ncbi:hypothetical protein NQ176_g3069 [Zarea fungicola]|uniref:Uncharacterized protein n=1 Tax=Zarea fungicola TaxID=93591 RepID=A0ACC1NMJ3_9HYPO|nr:hypothetical protein NQ176_g3069 [Lecanicillium fungicola]
MQLSSTLLVLPFLPAALANFHVGIAHKWTNPLSDFPSIEWTTAIACPSNYLSCKCYGQIADNADRGVGSIGHKSDLGNMFSLNSGLCGMGQLDFYYRSDRGVWEFYVNNGDGSLQGTCYSNSARDWCVQHGSTLSTDYDDKIWCDSYICGK